MKLHHIGIVVNDIDTYAANYCNTFGLEHQNSKVFDPNQSVNILFIGDGISCGIELIEPVGEFSPVRKFLQRGGGLYHLCYQVPDITKAIQSALENGALIIKEPVPAKAFNGKRVAFLMFREFGLVEFVEEGC